MEEYRLLSRLAVSRKEIPLLFGRWANTPLVYSICHRRRRAAQKSPWTPRLSNCSPFHSQLLNSLFIQKRVGPWVKSGAN